MSVNFDGNQCRIHLKHFSQPWETILWQSKAMQRFIPHATHTTHIVLLQYSHGREVAPHKLHVPCSSDPSPCQTCSCKSRCLLHKTSPPYPHQEHFCLLPGKQHIPSFLPCAGSPHVQLSAAVKAVMGKDRRAELGCYCCHCWTWKPW